MIFYIIKRIFILTELFLFLRLFLKFLGANPQTPVVDFIYQNSNFLVSPFEFILPNIYWPKTYLIETATISAIIGYVLAVFIIFQILRLFSRD